MFYNAQSFSYIFHTSICTIYRIQKAGKNKSTKTYFYRDSWCNFAVSAYECYSCYVYQKHVQQKNINEKLYGVSDAANNPRDEIADELRPFWQPH